MGIVLESICIKSEEAKGKEEPIGGLRRTCSGRLVKARAEVDSDKVVEMVDAA